MIISITVFFVNWAFFNYFLFALFIHKLEHIRINKNIIFIQTKGEQLINWYSFLKKEKKKLYKKKEKNNINTLERMCPVLSK